MSSELLEEFWQWIKLHVALITTVIGAVICAVIGAFAQWRVAKWQARHQLRMAALEKRLAVHQEAYTLLYELVSSLHNAEKVGDVASRCEKWWLEHCLYLDPKPRESFIAACQKAVFFHDLPRDTKEREQTFQQIMDVRIHLAAAVGLPAIGEDKRTGIKESRK